MRDLGLKRRSTVPLLVSKKTLVQKILIAGKKTAQSVFNTRGEFLGV